MTKSHVYGCLLLLVFAASPAFAQPLDADVMLLNLRVQALEDAKNQADVRRAGILQTGDDMETIVGRLKDDVTGLKNEVGRLSSELAALRAEVRALGTKPGERPTLTVRAPFAVVDATGRELLKVSDDASGAKITAPFRVTSNDRPILEMTDPGLKMRGSLTVNNSAGNPAALLESDSVGGAILTVGDSFRKAGAVTIGAAGGNDGFVGLATRAGKNGVLIGTPEERGMGVYVLGEDGDKVQASLGLDDGKKGIVRIGDQAAPHATLGHTKSGGVSFALYDGPGPDFRVGLLAAPDMSFVRLNKSKNAIHLNVDGNDGGAVHLFNAFGNAAASLQSTPNGYGRLSIGNVSGDTMVEAGVTTDGLGIVRAGPRIGGPATNNLTGLPFAIVGKKPSAGGGQN
jgi:hypothetical protein